MSLDVALYGPAYEEKCWCPSCGDEHTAERRPELYEANITHNLGAMAREAGIYETVWRPEEVGVTKARQLIEPLTKAVEEMRADPQRFKAHNSPNGWGLYEHFLPWLERYLAACREHPDADVSVSR